MSHRTAALALLTTLGLVGCSSVTSSPEVKATVRPTAAAPVLSTQPLTLTPTEAPVVPTERSPASGRCPPPPSEGPIPPIEDVLNYGDSFIQYLNAGGSVEVLAEHAEELNLLGNTGVPQGIMRSDLNGDDIPEIAISLVDWMDDFREGKVYVAMCESGEYRLSYTSPDGDFYRTAQIDSAFDMTGDGLDDLIIRRNECGAHTCFEWIEVVVWHEGQLQNRLEDVYFDLPSTGIEFIGPGSDGAYQIYMTGNGVSSIGAGPYHRRAVTWEWDQEATLFRPRELEFLPSTWRVHLVHDGDRAFADGNYMLALDAYERVIQDDTLQDWPSAEWSADYAVSRPQELAAYAQFRQILASLKLGDSASAEAHYRDLVANHPPGEYGAGFAEMGTVFWEEFTASQDFDQACLAAQRVAEAEPLVDLAPLDYGYSNPTYTPAEMCPTNP